MSACEATVDRYGASQPCGRPIVDHGLCNRPGDHVEEEAVTPVSHNVLVMIPNYWGKGATEAEAVAHMVGAGGRRNVERVVWHFPPTTTRVAVSGLDGSVSWWGGDPTSVERVGPRGKRTDITADVLGTEEP